MERRYGKANRIWVVDRGIAPEENNEFLGHDRRYVVGTPRSMLKRFEQQLVEGDWKSIRDGLEVKICPSPTGNETFVLCRSQDRRQKERRINRSQNCPRSLLSHRCVSPGVVNTLFSNGI